jgi:hypothetical protein
MTFTKNSPPRGYYVYFYLSRNGRPYYVGLGRGARAWIEHNQKAHTGKRSGVHTPKDPKRIVIYEWDLTLLWASLLERKFIRFFGRRKHPEEKGILLNKSDGGQGGFAKGTSMFVNPLTNEVTRTYKQDPRVLDGTFVSKGAGAGNSMYGKKASIETRALMSLQRTGRKQSQEVIDDRVHKIKKAMQAPATKQKHSENTSKSKYKQCAGKYKGLIEYLETIQYYRGMFKDVATKHDANQETVARIFRNLPFYRELLNEWIQEQTERERLREIRRQISI